MDAALIDAVRKRAGFCCEYCRLPQPFSCIPFEIDHVIARKHRGPTTLDNLALSCFYCNSSKGPNIAGLDPDTGALTPLYHPRREQWDRHFRWDGPRLLGQSPIGRVTIEVLAINADDCVSLRASLLNEGVFPPAPAPPST
jgi:hypothetical protein